jgi:hypothetical protein
MIVRKYCNGRNKILRDKKNLFSKTISFAPDLEVVQLEIDPISISSVEGFSQSVTIFLLTKRAKDFFVHLHQARSKTNCNITL